MDANQTCDTILKYIKDSNLNFSIVESPFSATITIKKTFIKNKDGTSRLSGLDISPQPLTTSKLPDLKHDFSPSSAQSLPPPGLRSGPPP